MKLAIPMYITNKQNPEKPASININYAGHFISLIKLALSSVNTNLYEDQYHTTKAKNFATCLYFPGIDESHFHKDSIDLNKDGQVMMYFSVPDSMRNLSYNYLNAFIWLHQQTLKKPLEYDANNNVKVGSVFTVRDTSITLDHQIFKTASPIVAQNKDHRFISCTDDSNIDEYTDALKSTLRFKYANDQRILKHIDSLTFNPLATKKRVLKQFQINVEATTGMFELTGDPELLNLIQQGGLGSRTGEFCGMVRAV